MHNVTVLVLAGWIVFSLYSALCLEDPVAPLFFRKLGGSFYYAIGMVALIVYFRWPGVAWRGWLDPDESTTIAQAIRAVAEPVPWLGFDSSTSGPLNSYFVALVAGWSKPITLLDARLAGLICWVGSWLSCYLVARRWFGEVAARVGLGVTGCFVALATQSGFVHFSSEQLPMLLLCLGWLLFSRAMMAPTWTVQRNLCWLTIFELTLVPLAKPQGGPIAVGLAFWAFAWGCRQARMRGAGVVNFILGIAVAGLLLPGLLFGWVVAEGGGRAFYQQFILWNFGYAGSNGFIAGPATGADWSRGFAIMLAHAGEFAGYFAGAGLVLIASLLNFNISGRCAVRFGWRIGWVVLFGSVSYFCVMIANKGFTHYLCFIVFPVGALLSLVASWSEGCANPLRIVRYRWIISCIMLFGISPMVRFSMSRDNPYGEIGGGRYAGMPELIDQAIGAAKPQPEDRIAVWGWVPEVFVISQLTPATPFVSGQASAPEGCLVRDWYRARFLECIIQERPRFFLDAVAPGAQGYGYLISSPHESDEALAAWIRSHYNVIAEIHGAPDSQPVRLFEYFP